MCINPRLNHFWTNILAIIPIFLPEVYMLMLYRTQIHYSRRKLYDGFVANLHFSSNTHNPQRYKLEYIQCKIFKYSINTSLSDSSVQLDQIYNFIKISHIIIFKKLHIFKPNLNSIVRRNILTHYTQ